MTFEPYLCPANIEGTVQLLKTLPPNKALLSKYHMSLLNAVDSLLRSPARTISIFRLIGGVYDQIAQESALTCISVIAWHCVNISADRSVNLDAQATSLKEYIGWTVVALASSHSMLTKGSSVRVGGNGVV